MKNKFFLGLLLTIIFFACKTDPKSDSATTTGPSENATTKQQPDPTTPPPPPEINFESDNGRLFHLALTYRKYINLGRMKTAEVEAALSQVTSKEMDFVKSFIYATTQMGDDLLTEKFLKKPSKLDLQNIYKMRRVNWNSMDRNGVTVAVIDTFDISTVNNQELVSAYYRLIANGLKISRRDNFDYSKMNIDLDNMGLADKQEKGIALYTLTDPFSRKYNDLGGDCSRSKAFLQKVPKVNGKLLLETNPPKFKDFKFLLGNWSEDKSFKEYFETNFKNAKKHFQGC
ncbi:MAG: hypothetical protein AB8F74_17775 [Saprospiraceae bacterium]